MFLNISIRPLAGGGNRTAPGIRVHFRVNGQCWSNQRGTTLGEGGRLRPDASINPV
jgi:hypothetical protein